VKAQECEISYARGLAFFGKISANVSHEIKNHLAVINEIGGLLQDLCVMAQKKDGLDPVRVESLSRNITHQIAKTDSIIKAFNYFSHSVDKTKTYVDLNEFAELMVRITRRLSANKGKDLSFVPETGKDITLFTNPFLLEQLYYFCLEHIISREGSGKNISISAIWMPTGGQLVFFCQDGELNNIEGDGYLDFLKRELKAALKIEPEGKKLILNIVPLPA
jgi:light-regulated signal transduction histidine kinase (bacteriophytochrome)